MGTWNGWQKQLLQVAGLPSGGDNDKFMGEWNAHATTDCANNPVDISLNISGASPCSLTSNPNKRARNYAGHDQAAGQFAAQLHSGDYPHLLAALNSGNPYNPNGSDKVSADLQTWGSGAFATRYTSDVNVVIGGGKGSYSDAFKGWGDLRRSVNKHMPAALAHSDKQSRAALRALAKARKVKL